MAIRELLDSKLALIPLVGNKLQKHTQNMEREQKKNDTQNLMWFAISTKTTIPFHYVILRWNTITNPHIMSFFNRAKLQTLARYNFLYEFGTVF